MNLSTVTTSRVFDCAKFIFTGLLADGSDRQVVERAQRKPVDLISGGSSVPDLQVVCDALAGLTAEQQDAVKTLLEAERQHASRWWTYLNEMRFSGDLPDWVKTQCVGTHPDYDRWNKDRKRLNVALFGTQDLCPLDSFRSVRFDL